MLGHVNPTKIGEGPPTGWALRTCSNSLRKRRYRSVASAKSLFQPCEKKMIGWSFFPATLSSRASRVFGDAQTPFLSNRTSQLSIEIPGIG
jgi:hypothetical protein